MSQVIALPAQQAELAWDGGGGVHEWDRRDRVCFFGGGDAVARMFLSAAVSFHLGFGC